MGPRRGPDGVIALTLPLGDRKMPGIAADDIGPAIAAIFKDKKYIGKRIGLAGEHPTAVQMAAILTKVLGKYVKVSPGGWWGMLGLQRRTWAEPPLASPLG